MGDTVLHCCTLYCCTLYCTALLVARCTVLLAVGRQVWEGNFSWVAVWVFCDCATLGALLGALAPSRALVLQPTTAHSTQRQAQQPPVCVLSLLIAPRLTHTSPMRPASPSRPFCPSCPLIAGKKRAQLPLSSHLVSPSLSLGTANFVIVCLHTPAPQLAMSGFGAGLTWAGAIVRWG